MQCADSGVSAATCGGYWALTGRATFLRKPPVSAGEPRGPEASDIHLRTAADRRTRRQDPACRDLPGCSVPAALTGSIERLPGAFGRQWYRRRARPPRGQLPAPRRHTLCGRRAFHHHGRTDDPQGVLTRAACLTPVSAPRSPSCAEARASAAKPVSGHTNAHLAAISMLVLTRVPPWRTGPT